MAARHDLITIGEPAGSTEEHRLIELPVLVLHAHSSCNCRCVMCDIWKTKDSRALQSADLESHLESIRRLGVRWVVLSGGGRFSIANGRSSARLSGKSVFA